MQLSKIEFVADWQRVMGSDTALNTDTVLEYIKLRAQADARPVAEWQSRYMGDLRQPGQWERSIHPEWCARVYKEHADHTENGWEVRPLYTHLAEASAPGLSDVELKNAISEVEGALELCEPESQQAFEKVKAALTRASAATVAEPVKVYPQGVMGIPPYDPRASGSHQATPGLTWNAQQAEPGDIPADIADALERTDWTPEEALCWYAAGKHFDVVNGRTRILDTGSIASIALKRTSPEYHAMKGADASFDAPVAQQQAEHCMCPACKDGVIHDSCCSVHNMPAYPNGPCDCSVHQAEPGADERAAFEADYLRRFNKPGYLGRDPVGFRYAHYLTQTRWEGWQARAAQSGQRAGVAEGWKLVPKEPTPEIMAGAALAVLNTAEPSDIELAKSAARIVLKRVTTPTGMTVDMLAASIATMAPAYRSMIAAAPTQQQEGGK